MYLLYIYIYICLYIYTYMYIYVCILRMEALFLSVGVLQVVTSAISICIC